MESLIVAIIIIAALWSTSAGQLVFNHLNRVSKGGLSSEPSGYQVVPGSHRMLDDIAEEIRSRMEGVASGRYVVVFDFGGVSPKYFSIIDKLVADSGRSEGEETDHPSATESYTVYTTPASIAQGHVQTRGSRITRRPRNRSGTLRGSATRSIEMTTEASPEDVTSEAESTAKLPDTTELLETTKLPETTEPLETIKLPEITQQSPYQVAIANKQTNQTVTFTTITQEPLSPTDAGAVFTGLKPAFVEISEVTKSMGFSCVHFKPTNVPVNVFVVDSIVLGNGSICGLDHMKISDNVTVIKDDDDKIEVTVPMAMHDLTVEFSSIDVKKFFVAVISGVPLEATVKEISYTTTFTFEKSAPLKLQAVRFQWGDIRGVHIKSFEGKGLMSDVVDYVGEVLGGVLKSYVSPVFDEIEREIRKHLLGRQH